MTPIPPLAADGVDTRARRPRGPIVVSGIALIFAAGAIVAIAQRGGQRATARPTPPTTSPSPQPPTPVVELVGTSQAYRVALRWSRPVALPDGARYEIRREGTFVAYVEPPAHRFKDDDVVPGERYRYEVRVETTEGTFSDPESVRVTLPLPPLSDARLQGTFDVKTRFTSKTGYGDYAAPGFGWRFRPGCADGACDVSLRDILRDELRLKLERTGATYRGQFAGDFGLECGGTSTVSVVTFELRVTKADVVDDGWRATRLIGSLNQRETEQLGCRASSATLTLSAKVYL